VTFEENRHVLISYKREDEVRVARLIRALQHHGLTIWWDQGLPGGEEWRASIERALDRAGCVIVVWSEASVAEAGAFVRDEASRALARGVLLPVRIDQVRPPLGFGEFQTVDLAHWGGGPNDQYIVDLVALCRSKLDSTAPPPAKARAARLLRRAAFGSSGAVVALLVAALTLNFGSLQAALCTLPGPQPLLSDACGAVGLGGRPSRAERLAWESRDTKSCTALRQYLREYPRGSFRSEAMSLLQTAQTMPAAGNDPISRTIRGFVGHPEKEFSSELAAKTDSIVRVKLDAQQVTCQPLSSTERLLSSVVIQTTLDCRHAALLGWSCSADYTAQCNVATQRLQEVCS
jgi:hypothetical protein